MNFSVQECLDDTKEIKQLKKKFGKELSEEDKKILLRMMNDAYISLMDKYSKNSEKQHLMSHSAKYIHSATQTSSFVMNDVPSNGLLLETPKNINHDIRYDSSTYMPGIKLLRIQNANGKGKSFLQCIEDEDYSPFDFISCDLKLKKLWFSRFKHVSRNDGVREVDKFAKQILFPLGDDAIGQDNYINLIPLFPTSLYHEIHHFIVDKLDDSQNEKEPAKSNRRKFRDLAVLEVGGENAQNVSNFNSEQLGRVYLFNSAAPKLRSIDIKRSIKNILYIPAINDVVKEYVINYKKTIFSRDYALIKKRHDYTRSAYDDVCNTLIDLKNSRKPGWTDKYVNLKEEHKLLIDNKFEIDKYERDRCNNVLKEDFKRFMDALIRIRQKDSDNANAEIGIDIRDLKGLI